MAVLLVVAVDIGQLQLAVNVLHFLYTGGVVTTVVRLPIIVIIIVFISLPPF